MKKRVALIEMWDDEQERMVAVGRVELEGKKLKYIDMEAHVVKMLKEGLEYNNRLYYPDENPVRFFDAIMWDLNRGYRWRATEL